VVVVLEKRLGCFWVLVFYGAKFMFMCFFFYKMFRRGHLRSEGGHGHPGEPDQLVPAGAITTLYSPDQAETWGGDVRCRGTTSRNCTLGRTPLIRVTAPEDRGVGTSEPAECLGLGVGGTRCPTSKWV
jgi:hypothetical protein